MPKTHDYLSSGNIVLDKSSAICLNNKWITAAVKISPSFSPVSRTLAGTEAFTYHLCDHLHADSSVLVLFLFLTIRRCWRIVSPPCCLEYWWIPHFYQDPQLWTQTYSEIVRKPDVWCVFKLFPHSNMQRGAVHSGFWWQRYNNCPRAIQTTSVWLHSTQTGRTGASLQMCIREVKSSWSFWTIQTDTKWDRNTSPTDPVPVLLNTFLYPSLQHE